MAKKDDKDKRYKTRPELEAVEPRLLFSAGLEGVLAATQLETPPDDYQQTVIEQTLDQGSLQSTEASIADARLELIFVDTDVPEYQTLLSDLLTYPDETTRYEVFELDNTQDGLAQISAILSGFDDVNAVHILSHGEAGAIDLGGTTLDGDTLAANVDLVQSWGSAFTDSADILIYGCDLVATAEGQLLVNSLSTLTGADVAASDDLTGNAQLGGDWELEYSTGSIETTVAISQQTQDEWLGLLAVSVDATTSGYGAGTSSVTISHTTVANSDRLMLVSVAMDANAGPIVNSVTYGGQSLTLVGSQVGGGAPVRIEIWQLINPTAGTANVVVSLSKNADGVSVGATTFSGVDQTTALGTFASAIGTSNTPSVNVSSAVGDLVYDVVAGKDSGTLAPGAGQTELWDVNASGQSRGASSVEAGAATVTMSWAKGSALEWAIGGVSIKAAATNIAPTITSNGGGSTASVNVAENTASVTTVTATDADLDTLTYSISGGADAALFSIDANSGVLTFNTAPDFEAPADANADNVYIVTVLANDGKGGTDTQTINVTVTNILELVVTNTNATGSGSLHQAILDANANPGQDTISFSISAPLVGGAHTIQLTSELPFIDGSVIIDGTTDPDYAGTPLIVLDGSLIGGGSDNGFASDADFVTIRGFVIQGFSGAGIHLSGSGYHTIESNYIGTDVTGTVAKGNGKGIYLGSGADNVTIGGAGVGNLISGNLNQGIHLDNVGSVTIKGNLIGTDATGTADLGNATKGIEVYNSSGNTIGGATAADRNVISGNNDDGIILFGAMTSANTIQGNYIGVDATGNTALGNGADGIAIGGGANNNTIGGDRTAGECNVISGQVGVNSDGIEIDNVGADNNRIYGNYIGTNYDGTVAIANARNGVVIYDGVQGTQIGGTGSGQGNIISGNNSAGIVIDGNGKATTTGNVIVGNHVGLNAAGTAEIANITYGIDIFGGATGNSIGGTTAAERNVISGNQDAGIHLADGGGNVIQGNHIGMDAAGTAVIANSGQGIYIDSTSNGNTIGGTATGAGNLISGNNASNVATSAGIYMLSSSNTLQGNLIGTDITGTANLANNGAGIALTNSAANNLIGGTSSTSGNIIGFNNGDGLRLFTAAGSGNSILGNQVFLNGGDGIDLKNNGVTANDVNDTDTGPNDLQNYPVITQADLSGTSLTLSGTLDTDGLNTQYRIEFFGNAAGTQDATNGEGRFYLGSTTVTTNGSGDASFSGITLTGVTLNAGDYVTATATVIDAPAQVGIDDLLAYGSTSEFSVNVAITDSNTAPTTGGIADYSVNEDVGFSFIDLNAIFDDAEDPDAALIYTITNNTNPSLFDAASINGSGVLTLDYAADQNGAADITLRATDTGGLYVETTFTVTVNPVNDAPVLTAGTVSNLTVNEDSGLTSLGLGGVTYSAGGGSDESVQTLSYSVTAIPSISAGDVFLADGTTRVTTGPYTLDEIRGMQFRPADDWNGTTAFQFNVTDSGGTANGGADSISQFILITVNPVNDAPLVDLDGTNDTGTDFAVTFTEDGGAVAVADVDAIVSDVESSQFSGLSISVPIMPDGVNEKITIGSYTFSYGISTVVSRAVGGTTFEIDYDGTGFNIVREFGGLIPAADLELLIRGMTYENISQDPTAGDRTIQFVAVDDLGAAGPVSSSVITVNAVNDDPTNTGTLPTDLVFLQDTQGKLDLSAIDLSDVDANGGSLTLTITSDNGHLQTLGWPGVTLGGSQSQLMLTGSLTDLNDFLNDTNSIDYEHATPGISGDNVDRIVIQINDNGNTGSGGGGTILLGTVNIDITSTNADPVISSDGGGTTANRNIAENTTAVTTVTATDADFDTLTYSISGGVDAALFNINSSTGELTFVAARDFESPGDADANNNYEVTVKASDGNGGEDTQAITVTITNTTPVAVDDAYAVDADATLDIDWWDTDWTHRQTLTFDNLAQSETLTDFPVLLVLNPGNIDYTQTQDDGSDLRFFAADGSPLAYEIEQWNEGGESSVWVRVPQITGSSNTDSIWMYYGNATAEAASDSAGVWDANFVGVWHLNEEQAGTGTAGVYQDSTANGNDGIDRVASTGQEGQVTDGQQLGANDWIEIDHDASLDLKDSMTISFWIKPTSDSGTFNRVVEKGLWGYNDSYYFGGGNGTNDLTFYLNGQEVIDTPDNALTVGVWQHAAVSYTSNGDGTGTARLYIDGVEIATGGYTNGAVSGNTGRLAIGHDDPLYDFDGFVDEVQISNTDRTADWIAAQYQATMNQFGTEFVQFGGEQTAPATGGVMTNDVPDGVGTIATNLDTAGTLGLVTLNADGTFSYDPNGQFDYLADGQTATDTFTYTLDDGTSPSTVATVTITVTGVNDAPVITSDGGLATATVDIAENQTAVTMVTASDVDAGNTPTFSISGGADAALFTINASTGALSFVSAPDFENPTDVGTDNVYNVTVQVSDGNGGVDSQTITVNVIDMADGIRVTPIDVVPLGGETLVNTSTTDNQQIGASAHQGMATDANGNYIVVWSSNLQDGSGWGIYAQRYSADGTAVGSEFLISTTTTDSQLNPAVAMDAAGNFVITWQSNLQDGDSYGIYAQRYTAAGVAQGAEFQVNTTTTGYQGSPAIAMDADGDFVIAWVANGQDPDASLGIYAQRFDASGSALGGEFRVNTFTTGTQQITSISMDAAGNFVIIWASLNQDGSNYGIFGQRFDASGVAQGAEFQVNTTTANSQLYHDVVMLPDGRFVVEYQSRNADGSFEVFMQRYAADGAAIGGEIRVNTTTVSSAQQPIGSITADASGNITVVWNSDADGDGTAVVGQRFDWAGNKLGGEFVVNTTTAGNQTFPEVIAQSGGRFIVAWGGNGNGDADGVFMQRYGLATSEEGGSATFQIVLESAPTADVTIPISVNDPTEGMVSVGFVTFTAGDWNIAQTVTITGVQDFTIDGDQVFQVIIGAATSADANFNGLDLADLTILNTELPNQAPSGVPVITGTVTEDQTLTADTSGISDPDGLGTFSYQWLRDGVAIAGATTSTYTLGDADVGTQISVQVSYTDARGSSEGPLVSAQTGPVVNVNDAPVGLPAITGLAQEDQVLTADASGISDADGLGAFSYQWLRDGVAVAGATASTFTLGDVDVGAQISVQVSYTDGQGISEGPLTSVQTAAVTNVNDTPVGVPAITGTATEDQVLTADTSGISDADGLGAFAYQWLRDGVAIGGATGSTYTLGDADVGAQISVQVSYTDGMGTSEGPLTSAQTAAVANMNDAPVGVPTITGSVQEDQVLTADTSGISDADGLGAFSYQWLRDGVAIGGATGSTYTLGDADVGTQISVQVSYTDGQGTSEGPLTSAQTAAVTNVNDTPVGLPTITGTVQEDQVLTTDTSSILDADGLGVFSYQWLRDGVAIGAATSSTYTLGDADVGAQISVQVSYTDSQGTNESVTSAQTAAVTNINDAPTGSVTIDNMTPAEGDTLTTSDTLADADGLSGPISYQWYRDGAAIDGATGTTYITTQADVGAVITVIASYTDDQGTPESISSAGTAAVTNVNNAPTGAVTINGSPIENQTLTASNTLADSDGLGAISFQWYRDGVAISGATGSTYTTTQTDVGTVISVLASYTDGQGTNESVSSAGVGPIVNLNDVPVVTSSSGTTGYAEQNAAVIVDPTITIVDVDGFDGADPSDQFTAVIRVTGNYSVDDVLGFTDTANIQGSLAGDTLTLSVVAGQTATVADFEAALRSVTFYNASDNPGILDRTVSFTFDDGVDGSNTATKVVQVSALNDAPSISGSGTVFINEIHYDNNSTDAGEAIELAGTAGMDLSGWSLVLYNGFNGTVYRTEALSGLIPDQGDSFGALAFNFPVNGIQNGDSAPDGIALVDDTGAVVQFISYEGSFTAAEGPAAGLTSTDIGVFESGVAATGNSLQLTGPGPDFSWATEAAATFGSVNTGQSFAAVSQLIGNETVAEDAVLVFSIANGNAISVSDPDAGAGAADPLLVTLNVASGTLTLGSTTGLTSVTGNGTASITFQGAVNEVNATLEGLTYQGNLNYAGSDTLTIVVDDQGNTGSGGALSDTGVVEITVTPENDAPTGTVTVSGTPIEDQTLTASNTLADVDGLGTISYQWYRDGVAIAGATGSTYALGDADVGRTITVMASYTDGQGTNESVTSAGVGPIANVNDTPTGNVSIDNLLPAEGDTLTASNTLADVDGLSGPISYQWYRDGVAIAGATGATYTTTQTDVSAVISVVASYTDDQGTAESVSSANTAAVTNVNNAPTGSVTIDNTTPAEGDTLTASNTLADIDGLSGPISYQWYRDGVAIAGATGATYTTTQTDVSAVISAVASYTDDQGTAESVSSAGTSPVTNVNNAPTGSVTINNTTPAEGDHLTASNTLADADGLSGPISYQWYRDGVAIAGATGSTYTTTQTDVSAVISVVASYTDDQGTAENVSSGNTAAVTNVNNAPTGSVTIDNTTPAEGDLLAASNTLADVDGLSGPISYQWYRDGVAIAGATGSSYTTVQADVSTVISVVASYTDDQGTAESVSSAGTAAVTNVNNAPTGSVTIDNTTPAEGDTLTASNTLADVDGLSGPISYQWYRDGVAIGGATGSTYTTVQADVSTVISVVASYTDDQGTAESVSSANTAAVTNVNNAPTGSVTIDNTTPAEGDLLTASNTLADVDGLSGPISYQWYRDGVAIAGAIGSTYTTVQADVSTVISVVASYTDDQGTAESVSSAGTSPVTNVNNAPTGSVSIDNVTPAEGDTLTASNTLADADGLSGPISYQWYRDGVAIAGATGSSYTTVQADVSTVISVVASYTDDQGTAESVSSANTAAVTNVNNAPTGSVTVDNTTPAEGDLLTASNTLADVDGLSGPISYQWYRDGVAIAGATGSTYTTTQTDVGTVIGVVASYTDDQGTAESVSSANTAAVTNVNNAPTGSVTIDNTTPAEGDTLTVSNTLADADGLSGPIAYQWYRDGVAIGGATGMTYTTVQADVGAVITVVASYTDDQGMAESVSSAGTTAVTNVNNAPTGSVTISGTPTEDQTLSASNTLADADGMGAISYQWYRDGVAIGGATGTTYTLGDADVGATITVAASYTDGQGTNESVTSAGVGPIANVNDLPAGVPTITGTVTEDQMLTADTGGISDADGLGAFSYQWYRDGVAIGGATASTYTLGDADVGAQISVEVAYTDGHGTVESITSSQTAAVTNVNDLAIGLPSITGLAQENQVLMADTSAISDADGLGAFSYQWYRDGVAIGGASGSTYTLGDADVGAQISVQVSYTDLQGTAEGPLASAQTGFIANINDAPSGTVAISGTPTEDQVLTASNTLADADGLGAISYQWYRDGVAIGGAIGTTYTLGDVDVGATITVEASYTDGHGTIESMTSVGVGPIANVNDAPVGVPTITGTVTEDQMLTADTSGISDADGLGAFSYQWLRDGVAIGGATGSTYTLGDADVGTRISVQVSYNDLNGTSESVTSAQTAAVTNINDAPTGSVTIDNATPAEGDTLTASNTLADADGLSGPIGYQWYRDGVAIAGATGNTYTTTQTDVGTVISVVASYTDDQGTNESVSSAATAAVINVNNTPTGSVTIDNTTPAEGDMLTVSNTLADVDGLSGPISYQWYRDGVAIGGATGSTYTTVQADVGTVISVVASYADDQGTAESVSSAGTAAVTNVNNAPTGAVTIDNIMPAEGDTLTAANSLADVDGLSGPISYQWYRDGVAIGGATASTYTTFQADVGAVISVVASYTDDQGTAENVSSTGTAAVTNVNNTPTGSVSISGTPAEDQVLTASNTLVDADGMGAIGYQWYRDGIAIAGATGSTYTLGDADVGTTISVAASYTDGQGTNESVTSAGIGPVTNVNDAPAGQPVITGTVAEDQILTADASGISDADGLGPFGYQWYRDGMAIGGATNSTYTLGDADVGATITVEISYTDGQGTSEAITSAGVGPVVNVNDVPVGQPVIAGSPAEDQILTVDTTGITDADGMSGAFSYQWYRDGVAIAGANGGGYILGDADVGAIITATVSYVDDQGASESVSTAGVGPIANVNDLPTGSVLIDNMAPAEGDILTVSNSLADADGLSGAISYQWYRDGIAIGGATASTYTSVQADVGATISVVANYTDDQGTSESVSSASTAVVTNVNNAPTGSVTIDNITPAEGDTLTASNTLADVDGLSGPIGYQWYRDGVAIGGATGSAYTTVQADVGAVITVMASYTDDQGTAESISSAGTAVVTNVNNAPTGAVSISGMPAEDQTLTASNTLADVDGMGPVSYQWYRDGIAVAGATGSTYTLGDADVGTTITVAASYTDGQGTNESMTSTGVGPVVNVNDAPTGSVTIDNPTPAEGDMLTASNTLADADGLSGAISYQWYRDGVAIAGATGSNYTTVQGDVGTVITVVASYTDDQGTAESVSSTGTAAVTNVNNAPTGSVSISGTPAEDQTLTATNTLADVDGLGVIGYQWYRDGIAIAGASGSTYNLGDADVGTMITVAASYTDGQGTYESVTSTGVGPIANVNDLPVGVPVISGTVTEDQVLTADNTGISDADGLGALSYQWMRDAVAIAGATGSTYTLGDADVGSQISVTASYIDANGTAESLTSAQTTPVANVNDIPTGAVIIDNLMPGEGDTISVSHTLADADGISGPISFQWYRDGVAITGATGTTYMTTQADVGTVITVEASYTDDQGAVENESSVGALVAGVFVDPGEDTIDETVVPQTEPPVVLRDSVGATPVGSEEQSDVMMEIIASHEVAAEGDTDYRVDPYQYLDDADLELGEVRKENVIKHAVRSIVQAGYQITEEMLQLFDLTRIKLSEVDDQPASGLIKSVGGLALSVSAGVVSWVLRGGALAATMLSSVSVLKGFDPLPVMDMNRKKGNRPGHDDDADSDLDNMFEEADLEEKGEASQTAGKADK